jgi:hypothetical protein
MRIRELWIETAIVVVGIVPIVIAIWVFYSVVPDIKAAAQAQSPTFAARWAEVDNSSPRHRHAGFIRSAERSPPAAAR